VLLGFEPDLPSGDLLVAPHLPDKLGQVRLENLPLGGARVRVNARGSEIEVTDVPSGVTVTRATAAGLNHAGRSPAG
jgi:hypothetical protein